MAKMFCHRENSYFFKMFASIDRLGLKIKILSFPQS